MEKEPDRQLNNQKNSPKEINKYTIGYFKPETNTQKLEAFKKRLDAFKTVSTLTEAKDLLNKSMPVQLTRTVFFIGDAKCTIINKSNQLRICLQTKTEFITYHFI